MNDLKATYDSILKIGNSLKFESFDVVKIVNEYRNYWRPDKIETILLAESHVFTDDKEIEQRHSIKLPNYPTEFVRFVYNLSYGQKNVLPTKIRNNSGTPQYWKLFKEISEKNFRVINNIDGRDKLQQKIPTTPRFKRGVSFMSIVSTLVFRVFHYVPISVGTYRLFILSLAEKCPLIITSSKIRMPYTF